MLKRLCAVLLLLCLLSSQLLCDTHALELASAKEPTANSSVCNSDRIAITENACWYVDTMADGCLLLDRCLASAATCVQRDEAPVETVQLTDYPVDQVLYWDGCVLCSAGNQLLRLDADTGALLDSDSFDAPVSRFACSSDGLYVLAGGKLLLADGTQNAVLPVQQNITQFWLEDAQTLNYMTDEVLIHELNLKTGCETLSLNRASDLDATAGSADEAQSTGLQAMREKFPHGKYWNHMPYHGCGMYYNNQNSCTSIPCPKHNNYCGTSQQTCNGYAPNGYEISYQCWGYADKLGLDVSGRDPESQSYGWKKLYYSSSLNTVKAGDIIRFNKNGSSYYAHSIYVTAVSGDTITYTDCNYDGTCVIRWGQTISKSTLKSWFVFLLSAPSAVESETMWLFNVNAVCDGNYSVNTDGFATFDLYYKGSLFRTGLTDFRADLLAGSSYEVCNIQPKPGVLFDAAASSALSGTMTQNIELILVLDHYYLNSAGETVKTTLTDLPAPDKYSYRPICWALEKSIASGVSKTQFVPNQICTRAQVMCFLWNALGRPEPEQGDSPFVDVASGRYYYNPILWAYQSGVTGGTDPTHFSPDARCTRAQVVTFLWNAMGRPEPETTDLQFTDVTEDKYYYQATLWAVENGITGGVDATHFNPNDPCTRAQTLTFLYKLFAND